jgi:tRNA (guanine-N7-)-methyltransferase
MNVRLLQRYVDKEITKLVSAKSLSKIYIQFPDPWPKRKHYHRRLLQTDFIDILNVLLKEKGELEISTDHPDYKKWILERFMSRDDFVSLFKAGFSQKISEEHIITHFEKTKREEGFPPFFFKFQKVRNL